MAKISLEMLVDCRVMNMAINQPKMLVVADDKIICEMSYGVVASRNNGKIDYNIFFSQDNLVIHGPAIVDHIYLRIEEDDYFRLTVPNKTITLYDGDTITLSFSDGEGFAWFGHKEDSEYILNRQTT